MMAGGQHLFAGEQTTASADLVHAFANTVMALLN
jgi:hypothetical protein